MKKGKYVFIILAGVLLLFQSQYYRLKPKREIPTFVKERLVSLGEKALISRDVPISSVMVYKDSIIGEGYNTVYRDSDISDHAEIIAMNQVFKKYGNTFKDLDRSKLIIYSTFEPCEMCKGAMLHYGINNIYFEQNKSVFNQVKLTLKSLYYNWNIRRFDAKNLQEDLFIKHPDYKNK